MRVNLEEGTESPSREILEATLSYPKWCARLVSGVLKARCPFAAFLFFAIKTSRKKPDRLTPAPTFFPIPVPSWGLFGTPVSNSPANPSKTSLLEKVVFVMVMALNYWHSGGIFVEKEKLQRGLNKQQIALVRHLKALVKSDDPNLSFRVVSAGRRFPELTARLAELSEYVTSGGIAASPYTRTFPGCEEGLKVDNTTMPELEPYRDLDASRLLLHGKGAWDVTDFLGDELVMVYRDPKVIQLSRLPSNCPVIRDAPEEVFKLAKLWHSHGLLVTHFDHSFDERGGELVRVFNALKNEKCDRQIGDRRGRNSIEARVEGPSRWLPAGPDFQDLLVSPSQQTLSICATDRRDFYHQIWVTRARALCNTVGPGLPTAWFEETAVWPQLLDLMKKQKYNRLYHGDRLGFAIHKGQRGAMDRDKCWVAFGSVFQGDHAGVDLATEGHAQLLQDAGLLGAETRIQSHSPLQSDQVAQGLCIDDYFAVSVENLGFSPGTSKSEAMLEVARDCYQRQSLLGSPDKDVAGKDEAKVVGALLNSSARARKQGLVTLGAPLQKKLALSYVTLQVCSLGFTTDALHLCLVGAWVSLLMYRRPLMSVLRTAFSFVDSMNVDQQNPKVLRMPRDLKDELTLLAVLMPLSVTELSAPYHEKVYATDASSTRGAVVVTQPTMEEIRTLWKSCRSKGAYTRFRSQREILLQRLGLLEDTEEHKHEEPLRRPLAFRFDFIEVFSGASGVTKFVAERGFSVGPCIDLSESEEYDLRYYHVIRWLTYLCSEKLLKGFMIEPPCTTFSIMRRPQLRSLEEPFGFDAKDPQTALGTLLAQRSFQMMHVGLVNEVVGLLETPYSSRMRGLPSYRSLAKKEAADMCRTDSCRFGSVHMKPFRFLSVHAPLRRLARRCQCSGKHVVVQGGFTKASATYTPELSKELANTISLAMLAKYQISEEDSGPAVHGLENILVNQVASTQKWEPLFSWKFKKLSHVNILELSALLRLVIHLAKEAPHMRVVNLTDSIVVRGAVSKGRTSSLGLGAVLRKICACMTAAGIYLTVPYVPTRLNTADDPTREVVLRSPAGEKVQADQEELFNMACFPTMRRWASNWVRLILVILGPEVLRFRDRSEYRQTFRGASRIVRRCLAQGMDFDCTLGYPGEGPTGFVVVGRNRRASMFSVSWQPFYLLPLSILLAVEFPLPAAFFSSCLSWTFACLSSLLKLSFRDRVVRLALRIFCWTSLVCGAHAMPMFPRNSGDCTRATQRAAREPPTVVRPVLPITTALREKHQQVFAEWLLENEIDFDLMLGRCYECVEEINMVLVRYGKALYAAGRPYNHYLETINLVVAKKPLLRRMLQMAWDYAFSWVKQEPSAHHVAMPFQVLLGCVSVAILWGWDRVAGALALMWGALLRAGEFIAAYRAQLALPKDVQNSVNFVLLSIPEPKTRLTAARHQVAKLDVPDLVPVVDMAFGALKSHGKLWPGSGQSLRTRLKQILAALQLPTVRTLSLKPLDLGSLRSGGATWLITTTEQSDLVLRRGRWLNAKTMSIYLQESMAVLYLQKVQVEAKDKVLLFAAFFPTLVHRAQGFKKANVPTKLWNGLLQLEK